MSNEREVIDRMGQRVLRGPLIGYKATDNEMKCRGYQFSEGKIFEHDGKLEHCESGFHYCPEMPGVWDYYCMPCRVWKVRVWEVLEHTSYTGTSFKCVAAKIEFVEEIVLDGDHNSGHRNSGHCNSGDHNSGRRNSGDHNSGYGNSGDRNSGHCNSGDHNSGYRNSGDRNSGHCNSGDHNSGCRNSGDHNSGYGNSGDRNSGYCNSGDHNSGYYNITNRSTGLFNTKESFHIFNVTSKIAWEDVDHNLCYEFYKACKSDAPFDYAAYLAIPNATIARLKAYHKAAIAYRKEND